MSSKWRALQKRHRWTYEAMAVSASRLQALSALREARAEDPEFVRFMEDVIEMLQLPSTHAQLLAANNVSSSFLRLARTADKQALSLAVTAILELLFLENSAPLHRILLSALSQLPHDCEPLLHNVFQQFCNDHGADPTRKRRFALAAVASSLIKLPKPGLLKKMTEHCAPLIVENLSFGLQSFILDARQGQHPTPTLMEECQDAMSSLCYMFQNYAENLLVPCANRIAPVEAKSVSRELETGQTEVLSKSFENGSNEEQNNSLSSVFDVAVHMILDGLQSNLLSRECMVAAGVALSAAFQLHMNHESLTLMLANSIFSSDDRKFKLLSKNGGFIQEQPNGLVETAVLRMRNSTVRTEVNKLTDFGRLCLLRGLLTAISRKVLNTNLLAIALSTPTSSESGEEAKEIVTKGQCTEWQVWTLIFDGILPAVCNFSESSIDSHFKFHSVTALQICLQQIKTSVALHLTTSAVEELHQGAHCYGLSIKPYFTLSDALFNRILRIVWNNWEDPLTQTVKQIQIVFELLLDVHFWNCCGGMPELVPSKGELAGAERILCKKMEHETFLHKIATFLLAVGGHRKGRYTPLARLALHLGAKNMLDMNPGLLFETIYAMVDDDVCCSASTFLKSFLERLREDCWNLEGGVMEGNRTFRYLCMPPIISGIVSGNARLRTSLNTYALPVAFQIDSDCIPSLLAFALDDKHSFSEEGLEGFSWSELQAGNWLPQQLTTNQRVALLISVLKVARSLALLEGEICRVCDCEAATEETTRAPGSSMLLPSEMAVVSIKGQKVYIPISLLELSATHMDDSLRVDAAEILCLNHKTATMPSNLELKLLQISIPLNMRCSSTNFRMKWTSLFKKFFMRVHSAVQRELKMAKCYEDGKEEQFCHGDTVLDERRLNGKTCLKGCESGSVTKLQGMQMFMQWLSQFLVLSLYPSAPYERKNMAMELFVAMLDVWNVKTPVEKKFDASTTLKIVSGYIYNDGLVSKEATFLILGALVDSWDKLRETACKILMCYPSPLPGLETSDAVQKVLKWAKKLVNSPRVRESDAGALVLRLMFQKYVVELGWIIRLHPTVEVADTNCFRATMKEKLDIPSLRIGSAIGEYLDSLNDWLEWRIAEGERDLLRTCQNSFVHGVLLTFRYAMDEVDWDADSVHAGASHLREDLARLLNLLLRLTSVALWVVSADALDAPRMLSTPPTEETLLFPKNDGMECISLANQTAPELEGCFDDGLGFLAPGEQVVMVGCWLAMKEVSLLLGTITRKVPLPGCKNTEIEGCKESISMLDVRQLGVIGEHFLHVLLSMKHNGAIDKTRAGFVALCNRLLCSNDSRLNKLPELWLQQLMQRTAAKGQTVDDLLRRSAGIPAAFLALFLAEPERAPKKMLPLAMRWLIDLARDFLARTRNDNGRKYDSISVISDQIHGESRKSDLRIFSSMEERITGLVSKARDEGVVPTVHAFNVMRITFHDTNLVTDTSAFCADSLITSIQAFSSYHWEVRNAATLAFTALLHRTVGFMNVHENESARRAITGFEFFHRYPALHPFLLQELQTATLRLEQGTVPGIGRGKINKALHPSLGPVLIILSRLKPSIINTRGDDWLCPSAFIPYVTRCVTQSNLKVRILASRALAPLVSTEKLSSVLSDIAKDLPKQEIVGDVVAKNVQSLNKCKLSFNAVHGLLLLLHTLITVNCLSLPDLEAKRDIVNNLSVSVLECSWLGNIAICWCPMVTAAFLQVIKGLIEVAETCSAPVLDDLKRLLVFSCAKCLDDPGNSYVKHSEVWDPTKVALREMAGQLYFTEILLKSSLEGCSLSSLLDMLMRENVSNESVSAVLEHSTVLRADVSDKCLQRLRPCLMDPVYEVRLAVLKALYKFLNLLDAKYDSSQSDRKECSILTSILKNIHPLFMDCLTHETHSGCIYHILRNFFSLCILETKVQGKIRLLNMQPKENNIQYVSNRLLMPHKVADTLYCKAFWGDRNVGLEHWTVLLKIYKSTKKSKNKEIVLKCLGCCVREIAEQTREMFHELIENRSTIQNSGFQSDHLNSVKEALFLWLDLIHRHSAANEAVALRHAAAEAVLACSLLQDANWVGSKCNQMLPPNSSCGCDESIMKDTNCNLHYIGNLQKEVHDPTCTSWYAAIVLDVWFVCIKLLEDEDLDLRQRLAMGLQKIVSFSSCSITISLSNDLVPTQVENVIHFSFDFLTAQFGNWIVYLDYLARWVLKWGDATGLTLKDGNLVRRLFDKELDNHHEEGMAFIQLCCLHLKKCLYNRVEAIQLLVGEMVTKGNQSQAADGKCSFERFVSFWWRTFLREAEIAGEKCLVLERNMEWIGGVSYHQDAFKVLYPLLLGLLTFVEFTSIDERQCLWHELFLGMNRLKPIMEQLLANPLLFNLFLELVKLCELKLNCDLGASELKKLRGSAHFGEFNPLFLLK